MELVKFVAVGNKNNIEEYSTYTENILMELKRQGIVDNYRFFPENEEEYVFFGMVDRISDKNKLTLSILFEYETYGEIKQLVVGIFANDYKVEIDDDYLEKLKLSVKTTIRKDWVKIVWLYDDDASILSKELYSRFYVTENLIRRFINEFMVKTFGTEWWDVLADQSIKEKYKSRYVAYKTFVQNFNNVDDHLLSIDVGDLLKILTMKKMGLDPSANADVVEILDSASAGNEDKIVNRIKSLLTVKEDFWEKYFKEYFDDEFIESFEIFEANRNHVAHNKILDRNAYKSICKSIEKMDKYMQKALEKLYKDKKSLEQLQAEAQQYEECLLEVKQNDAGIKIRNKEGIAGEFEDVLYRTYGDIVEADALYTREDLDFSEMEFDPYDDTGELFTVVSRVTKQQLNFCYSMDINDYEGEDSTLTITCKQSPAKKGDLDGLQDVNTEGFKIEISYANGAAIYDEEQGYYLPSKEDGIWEVDIDNYIKTIVEFINSEIKSLKEYVDSIKDETIKEGKELPIADGVFCYNCDGEYICIDEEIAEIGTCLNCGEHNDIAECERCGKYFIDEDYDVIKLCESCKNNTDDDEDE